MPVGGLASKTRRSIAHFGCNSQAHLPTNGIIFARPIRYGWANCMQYELEVDSRARSMTSASCPAFRGRARARRHRRDLGRGMQMTIPALGEGRGQIELVEHAGDDVINEIIDRLR